MKLVKIAAALLLTLAAPAAGAQTAAPAPTPAELDSLAQAMACFVAPSVTKTLADLERLDAPIDREKFLAAFVDILRGGEPALTPREADTFIGKFVAARRPIIPDTLSVASQQAFIDQVAALPGANRLASGLVIVTEQAGSGLCPADTSTVKVRYTGRFANGYVFDSTDEPVEFTVGDLVPGFSEGLRHMQPGGRYRLIIPATLGYGARGVAGHIPGNAALDFVVDLIEIKPTNQ